jgi:thiol-disulfide isomerase/thioredoxin
MDFIKKSLLMFLALLFPLLADAVAVGDACTQVKLDALNKAGKPALVIIYADWCPTCKAQGTSIGQLEWTHFAGWANL